MMLPPEAKRTLKEKMVDLVRQAREQGYLCRDEVHEAFADLWSKPGEEKEAFNNLQLLDIQIVESLDLPAKPEPDGPDPDKQREAVDDLLRCYFTEVGTVPLL